MVVAPLCICCCAEGRIAAAERLGSRAWPAAPRGGLAGSAPRPPRAVAPRQSWIRNASGRSGSQSGVVAAASGNLIRRRVRPGGGWIGVVQLDLAARQVARRKPAKSRTACTSGITQLYAESVRQFKSIVVLRPNPEFKSIVRGRKVGVCCATDITYVRTHERGKIPGDARTAHMQPGAERGRVMMHDVHVAEESAVFTSSNDPEIDLRAIVVEDEPAARGEVTRTRKHVGFHHGDALEHQHAHQESPCQ